MSYLLRVVKRYPVIVQAFKQIYVICLGSLMAGGDLISQLCIERKKIYELEWIRPVRFYCIGFFAVGPTLRVWYSLLDRKFGSTTKIGPLKKTAVDQLLFAPFFLCVFIAVNDTMQHKKLPEIKKHIKADYLDILVANWMVWPAVQMANFSLVPLRHQVLVAQLFALMWNIYLAWKTNRNLVN